MSDAGDAKKKEVRRNYEALQKQLPGLLESHRGKFALMRNGKIVEFFDSARDAAIYGQKEFEDRLFSIQEITDRDVDLGYYAYAVHHSSV